MAAGTITAELFNAISMFDDPSNCTICTKTAFTISLSNKGLSFPLGLPENPKQWR
jgi:hypothetical protein